MTERPILFSGPMVRAILDGRKTVTRRLVKDAAGAFWDHPGYLPTVVDGRVRWHCVDTGAEVGPGSPMPTSPYGVPGDRLWVRETFCLRDPDHHPERGYWYAATDDVDNPRWTPSIHMPRRASRLTLDVTEVRVERLNAINEGDAISEGIDARCDHGCSSLCGCAMCIEGGCPTATSKFEELWDAINGKRAPWSSNPWVWVVGFEVEPKTKPNEDRGPTRPLGAKP